MLRLCSDAVDDENEDDDHQFISHFVKSYIRISETGPKPFCDSGEIEIEICGNWAGRCQNMNGFEPGLYRQESTSAAMTISYDTHCAVLARVLARVFSVLDASECYQVDRRVNLW